MKIDGNNVFRFEEALGLLEGERKPATQI